MFIKRFPSLKKLQAWLDSFLLDIIQEPFTDIEDYTISVWGYIIQIDYEAYTRLFNH